MKPLVVLDQLKKYLPGIVYAVLAIVVMFFIYQLFMRLRAGGLTIGGIAADKMENNQIGKTTGVPPARVQQVRQISHDLAYELETLKEMSYWDKVKHIQLDSDTIDILQSIRSVEEMNVLKHFYEQIHTSGRQLRKDLDDVLSAGDFKKVPFYWSI